MIYDETHAARLKDIKVLGNRFNSIVNVNNAGAHNSINRGKDLGTAITAQQLLAIRNGSFEDLYPGDYFTKNGWVGINILGCNPYDWQYVNEKNEWTHVPNHIAVRITAWRNFIINETPTTEGGLYNSYMHNTVFPEILAAAEEIAGGADNIVPLYTSIADAVDQSTGKPTHFIQSYEKIFLPTTAELWGYQHENTSYPQKKQWLPYYFYNRHIACFYRNSNFFDMAAPNNYWCGYGYSYGPQVTEWCFPNGSVYGAEFIFLIG